MFGRNVQNETRRHAWLGVQSYINCLAWDNLNPSVSLLRLLLWEFEVGAFQE
jgi:hypothetical protein